MPHTHFLADMAKQISVWKLTKEFLLHFEYRHIKKRMKVSVPLSLVKITLFSYHIPVVTDITKHHLGLSLL